MGFEIGSNYFKIGEQKFGYGLSFELVGSKLMGLKLDLSFEMSYGFRLWLDYGFKPFYFSFSSSMVDLV